MDVCGGKQKRVWLDLSQTRSLLAGGPGFEPGFTESESVVLPLNDPPSSVSIEIENTQNLGEGQ